MTFKPKFTINSNITKALVEVERVRGFLDAIKLKGEWLTSVQKEALILETHFSTHIEGTALTLKQATDIINGKKVEGVSYNDKKELLNYKKAMDFVSRYLGKNDPVTEGLIREIHKILVQGVRGGDTSPGNYRKVQNYVVNSKTKEVVYTPPTPFDVPHLMREFVEWINKPKNMSEIILAGICQFQFVHIHPFIDGNGRTARLLSTLILYKTGYDFKKLFTLSEYYDKNRPAYYEHIQSVRKNNMNMTYWLEYFAEGLTSQMRHIKDTGTKIVKYDSLLNNPSVHGLNERQVKAIRHIIKNGGISRSKYVKLFKVSLRTANYDLKIFEEKGVLKRIGIGRMIRYVIQ